jgi:hypothetical protein
MEAERFILAEGFPKDLLFQSYFSKDKNVAERRMKWFPRIGSDGRRNSEFWLKVLAYN